MLCFLRFFVHLHRRFLFFLPCLSFFLFFFPFPLPLCISIFICLCVFVCVCVCVCVCVFPDRCRMSSLAPSSALHVSTYLCACVPCLSLSSFFCARPGSSREAGRLLEAADVQRDQGDLLPRAGGAGPGSAVGVGVLRGRQRPSESQVGALRLSIPSLFSCHRRKKCIVHPTLSFWCWGCDS